MTSEARLQEISEWCSIQTPERMAKAIHKVEQEKDQLEAEKKELIEDVLHFSEWIDLVCLRDNRHKWTYKGDNHSKLYSTKEMLEIWKIEVNKLKQ